MKTFIAVVAILFLAVAPALSHGWWSLGFGPTGGSPIGDFSKSSDMGFGGVVSALYHVDSNSVFGFKTGYIHFDGKDINAGFETGGMGMSASLNVASNFTPMCVTISNYLSKGDTRVFAGLDLGAYALTETVDLDGTMYQDGQIVSAQHISSTVSETDIGFSPALGVAIKAGPKTRVDVSLNYTHVFTSGSSPSWIGATVALDFDL